MEYSEEDYDDLNISEYRERFPTETRDFTDEELFNIVMSIDDDLEDDEWIALFTAAKIKA